MSVSLINRLKLYGDYLFGRPVCTGRPVEITIESTTKCNLRCPMCTREELIPAVKDMDLALFKQIIDQGEKYLELITPINLGEPLLNPHIFEMIRYCKDKGLHVLLSTNGTFLDEKNSAKLLETGLDYLILSFDGARKETYEKYRLGANFEKVRANVLKFLQLKLKLKAHTHCILQMVILKDNQDEIKEFGRLWNVEGLDELRFKPNTVLGGEFTIPQPLDNPVVKNKPCFHLWRSNLVVRFDGVVFPCCWSYGELPVGDLRKQTLDEVWNAPPLAELRKMHNDGRAGEIPTCRNCSMSQPHAITIAGAFLLNGYRVRTLMPIKEKIGAFWRRLPFSGGTVSLQPASGASRPQISALKGPVSPPEGSA